MMMKEEVVLMKGGAVPLNISEYATSDANVGAAPYALKVFGAPDQQHAASGNVIAMKGGDASSPESSSPVTTTVDNLDTNKMQGGEGVEEEKSGGEGATGLAVPAVLLVANQMITRRRRSGKKHRRSHRKRRFYKR